MCQNPKRIPFWENFSCPDAETYITGIDYYAQLHEKEQLVAAEAARESAVPGNGKDLSGLRRQKIQERLAAALDCGDPLVASMGPVSCDLLEMLQDLKHGIDKAFAVGPMALERSEKLRPAIELYARLASQAYKLAHWSIQSSIPSLCDKGRITAGAAEGPGQPSEERTFVTPGGDGRRRAGLSWATCSLGLVR